ncbi:MAG: flagellar M-ring protein FliF [Puniceicoccaceae bacterium]|nr:MAG: flagellar M-ring protein FliF [Puniceicoccaceae bacterium]
MPAILKQIQLFWAELGLNQRISLVLAGAGVLAVMTGILVWSARPDMQLLYGRLDPQDASEIVQHLESSGIAYQLGGGGTSVYVPKQHVYRVRMDLASRRLPSGGGVGFEIFDRSNFGISDFVQRTNYIRALQGELARTVMQLDGVRNARVMVVLPENRLVLTADDRRPTASVFIETGGMRLAVEAVSSIRSLVANAVEGLRPADVVVVDNRGNVLTNDLEEEYAGGLSTGQLRYRKTLEDYYGKKVESMLSTVLGPGSAVVRVSVDIDSSSATITEERFDPESTVLRNQSITEDVGSTTESSEAGGVGTAANVANGGQVDATNSVTRTQQTRRTRDEKFEINRTTSSVIRAPGEIRRMTAAVFVAMRFQGAGEAREPMPRSPEEIESLRQVVINALGIQPERNRPLEQIVSVQEVDFAPDVVAGLPGTGIMDSAPLEVWFDIGRTVAGFVLGAAALIVFLRMLRRTRPAQLPLEALPQAEPEEPASLLEKRSQITPEMLNELIRQKPANVGVSLREWMDGGAERED